MSIGFWKCASPWQGHSSARRICSLAYVGWVSRGAQVNQDRRNEDSSSGRSERTQAPGSERERVYEDYIQFSQKTEAGLAEYAAKYSDAVRWDGQRHLDFIRGLEPRQAVRNKYTYRTAYQLDRDRILYSGFFPPLAHKTQMFSGVRSPVVRNRLTHTLRVNQIARSIARGLHLNEDLVEAIALGHDVGHPPFAHTGEEALNEWIKGVLGDKFRKQLGAVQQKLANVVQEPRQAEDELVFIRKQFLISQDEDPMALLFSDKPMLFMNGKQSFRKLVYITEENLTKQTLFGIWRHSRRLSESDHRFLYKDHETGYDLSGAFATYEAEVVRLADDLAWITHDIEDARRAGIISEDKLAGRTLRIGTGSERETISEVIGSSVSDWLTAFISNAVAHNEKRLNLESLHSGGQHVALDKRYEDILRILKKEISDSVHEHVEVQRTQANAKRIIKDLCNLYYLKDMESKKPHGLLLDLKQITQERGGDSKADFPFYPDNELRQEEKISRMWDHTFKESARIGLICDFVSALTDEEAMALHGEHFGPVVDIKRFLAR